MKRCDFTFSCSMGFSLWVCVGTVVFVFCTSEAFAEEAVSAVGEVVAADGAVSIVPEEILALAGKLAAIPDCKFEYTTTIEAQGGRMISREHRYVKKGNRWRDEVYENDALHEVLCFDGEKYYFYEPRNKHLVITKNHADLNPRNFMSFVQNPLYGWCFPVFCAKPSQFVGKEISSPMVWMDALTNFSIEELEEGANGEVRYRIDGPTLQYDISLSPIVGDDQSLELVESIARHKNELTSEFKDHFVKLVVSDWRTETLAGKRIVIPGRLATDTRHRSGKKVAGDIFVKLAEGSVQSVGKDLSDSTFRIPLSSVPDPVVMK